MKGKNHKQSKIGNRIASALNKIPPMSYNTKDWLLVASMIIITLIISALALAVATKEFKKHEDQRIEREVNMIGQG